MNKNAEFICQPSLIFMILKTLIKKFPLVQTFAKCGFNITGDIKSKKQKVTWRQIEII